VIGRMWKEYGLVGDELSGQNLPSSQADKRTTMHVVNNTADKCSGNNDNDANNNNDNETESVVSVVKMKEST